MAVPVQLSRNLRTSQMMRKMSRVCTNNVYSGRAYRRRGQKMLNSFWASPHFFDQNLVLLEHKCPNVIYIPLCMINILRFLFKNLSNPKINPWACQLGIEVERFSSKCADNVLLL